MDNLMRYFKKMIFSALLIYSFNVIAISINLIIPINIWTIILVGLFDLPGIAVLVTLKIIGV